MRDKADAEAREYAEKKPVLTSDLGRPSGHGRVPDPRSLRPDDQGSSIQDYAYQVPTSTAAVARPGKESFKRHINNEVVGHGQHPPWPFGVQGRDHVQGLDAHLYGGDPRKLWRESSRSRYQYEDEDPPRIVEMDGGDMLRRQQARMKSSGVSSWNHFRCFI
jgi:hypothetical protein